MAFALPELPYSLDALQPHISAETLGLHHGKHHAGYVKTLNDLVRGTAWETKTLEEIVRGAKEPPIHNAAAQAWNHAFYWRSMRATGKAEVPADVGKAMTSLGGAVAFQKAFTDAAVKHFGSGWAWLVVRDGKLAVESTHDAGCPIETGAVPLLTCDVWEHAYYVDYRNRRADYVAAWWNLVDWDGVRERMRAHKLL